MGKLILSAPVVVAHSPTLTAVAGAVVRCKGIDNAPRVGYDSLSGAGRDKLPAGG